MRCLTHLVCGSAGDSNMQYVPVGVVRWDNLCGEEKSVKSIEKAEYNLSGNLGLLA